VSAELLYILKRKAWFFYRQSGQGHQEAIDILGPVPDRDQEKNLMKLSHFYLNGGLLPQILSQFVSRVSPLHSANDELCLVPFYSAALRTRESGELVDLRTTVSGQSQTVLEHPLTEERHLSAGAIDRGHKQTRRRAGLQMPQNRSHAMRIDLGGTKMAQTRLGQAGAELMDRLDNHVSPGDHRRFRQTRMKVQVRSPGLID